MRHQPPKSLARTITAMASTAGLSGSWLGPLKTQIVDEKGSVVMLQPKRAPGTKVPTLMMDLKTGRVWTTMNAPALPESTTCTFGVLGLLRLQAGSVLALVTRAKRVTSTPDAIYHVEDTQLITHEAVKSTVGDLRLAAMFQEALDAKEFASHMYFSPSNWLLAQSVQGAVEKGYGVPGVEGSSARPAPGAKGSGRQGGGGTQPASSSTMWGRSDSRWVWNQELLRPLIEAGAQGFVTPVVMGYVGQIPAAPLTAQGESEPTHTARVTLISRLAARRAGTAPWRVGLDLQGNCAHTVETEVVVDLQKGRPQAPSEPAALAGVVDELGDVQGQLAVQQQQQQQQQRQQGSELHQVEEDGSKRLIASFTQLRSSLPVLWAAPPDLAPDPAVSMCTEAGTQQAAVKAHVQQLKESYQSALLLNLPTASHFAQGLTAAFEEHMTAVLGDRQQPTTTGSGPSPSASTPAGAPAPPGGQGLVAATCSASGRLNTVPASNRSSSSSSAGGGQSAASAVLCNPSCRRTLIDGLQPHLDAHGFFLMQVDERPSKAVLPAARKQSGVISLSSGSSPVDAINLLQAGLGIRFVEEVLAHARVLGEGHTLANHAPALSEALAILWSNQGDVLAHQLLGSSCLSGPVIRAGGGAPGGTAKLSFLATRLYRYAVHAFGEARRQDCCDLLTGAYPVKPGCWPPARREGRYSTLQLAGVCLAWLVIQLVFIPWGAASLGDILYRTSVPGLCAALLLGWVWLRRRTYVKRPLLMPELMEPWRK